MRAKRLELLKQYIQEKHSTTITDIAEHFHVSINTARRDISTLISQGGFEKVYGGIVSSGDTTSPYAKRRTRNLEGKQIIGKLAATLVEDNTVIFLDSGSTTPYIVEWLAKKKHITVVTYSLPVLIEAAKYPELSIIALGGSFDPVTASFCGQTVTNELTHLNIHTAFISSTCVSHQFGLSNYSYQEAEIKQFVVNCCSNVILVADHSKFGLVALRSFMPFENLSGLVTDCCPPDDFLPVIKAHNIACLYPTD